MYCNQCGKPNPDSSRFCSHCGQPVKHINNVSSSGSVITLSIPTGNLRSLLSSSDIWKKIMLIVFGLWAISAFLLFSNWFTIDLSYLGTIDCSVYSLNNYFSEISDYFAFNFDFQSILEAIIIFSSIVFIASLAATLYFFQKKLHPMFIFSVILSTALIVFTAFFMFCFSSITNGSDLDHMIYSAVLVLNPPPYILLFASIVSIVLTMIAKNKYEQCYSGTESPFRTSVPKAQEHTHSRISIPPTVSPSHSNITYIPGPKELTLSPSNISDISFLASKTYLEYLDISDNNASDISVLAELSNLRELYLANNNITDISALSDLTNLSYLSLDCNPISDLSPLFDLDELQSLSIVDCDVPYEQISELFDILPHCTISY